MGTVSWYSQNSSLSMLSSRLDINHCTPHSTDIYRTISLQCNAWLITCINISKDLSPRLGTLWCITATIFFCIYSLFKMDCSRLQDSEERRSRKIAGKPMGTGERRISETCKQCFQYFIPVYQFLVYPMIGQLWLFTSTPDLINTLHVC